MASEKVTAIVEELKTLTVLELSELVSAVEEEFGVSAAAHLKLSRDGSQDIHQCWLPQPFRLL